MELGVKQVATQYLAVTALANTFVVNSDLAVATSALARLKFVENSLQAISSTDEKIVLGLKEASGMLDRISAGVQHAGRKCEIGRSN